MATCLAPDPFSYQRWFFDDIEPPGRIESKILIYKKKGEELRIETHDQKNS